MKKSYLDFAIRVVKETGDLLIPYYEDGVGVKIKGGNVRDFVTEADIKANDFIINEIKKEFRDHQIHSEEGESVTLATNTPTWTIDPIDGTSNFSRQIPHFAVSIGLVENKEIVLGVVYNPITKELFHFEKGKGAYRNGKIIKTSPVNLLEKSFVFTRSSRNAELWKDEGEFYSKLITKASKISSLGSSALDACFVASGKIEASFYKRVNIKDIAAAVGILKEVGGLVVDKNGLEIDILNISDQAQTVIFANNRQIANQIIKLI